MTEKSESPNQPESRRFADRVEFNRVDENTRQQLRSLWPTVEAELPRILDAFYEHIMTVPALARLIGGRDEALKGAQSRHWTMLFNAEFDSHYAQSVRRSAWRITASAWSRPGTWAATCSCSTN